MQCAGKLFFEPSTDTVFATEDITSSGDSKIGGRQRRRLNLTARVTKGSKLPAFNVLKYLNCPFLAELNVRNKREATNGLFAFFECVRTGYL
jgi:hypothetical protein